MINYKDLWKTIHIFREFCLKEYPNDIDLMPTRERENRLGILETEQMVGTLLQDYTSLEFQTPITHITNLLKTPRLLKITLRRILTAWEHLHGEIDYDDLFVLTVLRFAAPQAYDFLLENINEIRSLELKGIMNDQKARRDDLKNKWKRKTDDVEWDVESTERLLVFLFPAWKERRYDHLPVLQGIRNYYPTDYWQRASAEFIPDKEIRDQETLQALKNWKLDRNDTSFRNLLLPDALYSLASLSLKFEQFAPNFLVGNDIREIAEALFKIILRKEGVKANVDSSPAFVSLWRLSTRSPIDDKAHGEWILNQILFALPLSLHFANDLYYYWKHNQYIGSDEQKTYPELRNAVIHNFKQTVLNTPEALINSLDPNYVYGIYQFAVLFSGTNQGGSGFEAAEWTWLSNLLLEAAKIQPQTVLPQIVPLIIEREDSVFTKKFKFNNETAPALFSDRLPELMSLLAQSLSYEHLDRDTLDLMVFARRIAHEWLDKNRQG